MMLGSGVHAAPFPSEVLTPEGQLQGLRGANRHGTPTPSAHHRRPRRRGPSPAARTPAQVKASPQGPSGLLRDSPMLRTCLSGQELAPLSLLFSLDVDMERNGHFLPVTAGPHFQVFTAIPVRSGAGFPSQGTGSRGLGLGVPLPPFRGAALSGTLSGRRALCRGPRGSASGHGEAGLGPPVRPGLRLQPPETGFPSGQAASLSCRRFQSLPAGLPANRPRAASVSPAPTTPFWAQLRAGDRAPHWAGVGPSQPPSAWPGARTWDLVLPSRLSPPVHIKLQPTDNVWFAPPSQSVLRPEACPPLGLRPDSRKRVASRASSAPGPPVWAASSPESRQVLCDTSLQERLGPGFPLTRKGRRPLKDPPAPPPPGALPPSQSAPGARFAGFVP